MNLTTEKTILFFDTETTGILKNDKNQVTSNGDLIQLAYRKITNWQKKDENIFVYTDTKLEIGAMATHGIYPELLQEKSDGKVLTHEQKSELWEVFTTSIIVAHNIDFDKDVLMRSWIVYGTKMIDTLKIAKILWSEWVLQNKKWEDPEYVNLQYLRYYFELYKIVDSDGNEETTTAHDAFWDVVVLEKVFYELFAIVKKKLNISDEEVLALMIEMTQKEFIVIKIMRVWKYRWKTFEEVASLDSGYLEWMIKADFTEDIKYTCNVVLGKIKDKKFII